MAIMEVLLMVVAGIAAVIILIIVILCLKDQFCRKRQSPQIAQFSVGGEGTESEHIHFLENSSTPRVIPIRERVSLEVEVHNRPALRPNNSAGSLRQLHLTSRPSAPTLSTSLSEDHHDTRRLPRAGSRPNFYSSTSSLQLRNLEDIRLNQYDLLRNGIKYNYNESEYNIILAVDAQPTTFGGYCVNLRERSVFFYSVDPRDLPWRFVDPSVNSEFEMKNYLFALMLWFDKLKDARKALIYTGYRAQNYDNSRYVRRAIKLLEHYTGCEGIVVGNHCRHHINWKKDPKSFSILIQPADDLASSDFHKFKEFIHDYYDIPYEKFQGSHEIYPTISDESSSPCHEVTENYHLYIDKVRATMKAWTNPCNKCGYVDDETASYMSLNKVSSM